MLRRFLPYCTSRCAADATLTGLCAPIVGAPLFFCNYEIQMNNGNLMTD